MNHQEELDKRMNNLISNVKNTEAELKDAASLTEDIMEAVTDEKAMDDKLQLHARKNIFQNVVFRRIISAAAIILFSIFAYEQYFILDKINRLEVSRQNKYEQPKWEFQTILKFQELKEESKILFKMVESVRQESGTNKLPTKTRDNMGIYKNLRP